MVLLVPALAAGGLWAYNRSSSTEPEGDLDEGPVYGPELPPEPYNNPMVPDFIEVPARRVYDDATTGMGRLVDQVPDVAGTVSRNAVGTFVVTTAVVTGLGWALFKLWK